MTGRAQNDAPSPQRRVTGLEFLLAYVEVVKRSYRKDRWIDQPEWIELWSEKGTIRGTAAPILDRYGITFRVMHGYERQRDQLREHLALAEMELSAATENQLDVEGALAFAEHLLTNAARLWMELGLDQKQQLQQVLFPEGLRFDGEKFGTAVTCLAFKQLAENGEPESTMASPTGTADVYRRLRVRLPRAA